MNADDRTFTAENADYAEYKFIVVILREAKDPYSPKTLWRE
jgi:hypothetical protein